MSESQFKQQNKTLEASQSPLKQRKEQQKGKVLEDNRELSAPMQRKPNGTGLPDNLKSGMESLSGMSLDHVKVHHNSSKPAAAQAHAYAQGSDIHLASGQEKHLPHELGHVVQQMQGRVKPTATVGGVAVNDNPALEDEATAMGHQAMQRASIHSGHTVQRMAHLNDNRAAPLVQRMVHVATQNNKYKNLKRATLDAAVKKAVAQGLIPDADASTVAVDKLMAVYKKTTIYLTGFMSLVHQVGQDLHMLANGNESLMGIAHQHSEFTYTRKIGTQQRDLTFKSGIAANTQGHAVTKQRVYRTMTTKDWENNHISGHGGSLGQAMHYFNLGKKASKDDVNRKPDLLVEFTFTGTNLTGLLSQIKSGGEGKHSTDSKLGGKTENNTAFGVKKDIFSVDLKHASGLLSKSHVTAKVLASTNTVMPDDTKKGQNVKWQQRPNN